jgi:hypothetical protein
MDITEDSRKTLNDILTISTTTESHLELSSVEDEVVSATEDDATGS